MIKREVADHETGFSANSVQFATLTEKVNAAKFLSEIGAATLDQILTMFDLPTIGGEDGARRVQTLRGYGGGVKK